VNNTSRHQICWPRVPWEAFPTGLTTQGTYTIYNCTDLPEGEKAEPVSFSCWNDQNQHLDGHSISNFISNNWTNICFESTFEPNCDGTPRLYDLHKSPVDYYKTMTLDIGGAHVVFYSTFATRLAETALLFSFFLCVCELV